MWNVDAHKVIQEFDFDRVEDELDACGLADDWLELIREADGVGAAFKVEGEGASS